MIRQVGKNTRILVKIKHKTKRAKFSKIKLPVKFFFIEQ